MYFIFQYMHILCMCIRQLSSCIMVAFHCHCSCIFSTYLLQCDCFQPAKCCKLISACRYLLAVLLHIKCEAVLTFSQALISGAIVQKCNVTWTLHLCTFVQYYNNDAIAYTLVNCISGANFMSVSAVAYFLPRVFLDWWTCLTVFGQLRSSFSIHIFRLTYICYYSRVFRQLCMHNALFFVFFFHVHHKTCL